VVSLAALRTLVALARDPSFTRVAEVVRVTQPAVSQQMQALRLHFGVTLVDVVGRRAVLTDAGRFLAERALPILGALDALERDMRDFSAAERGELRIGASETVGNYVLAELIAAFSREHPAVRIDVEFGNTTAIVARLRSGALTFALVEGAVTGDDLDERPFADDELVLVLPPGHALTAARIDPASLRALPFVAREPGSGTRALFEQRMREAGVTPHITLEFPTGEAVVRAAAAGLGVAMVSRRVAADAAAQGRVTLRTVDGLPIRRTLRIVRLARVSLSPAAAAFIATATAGYAATSSG
jgi:DNA-binding transcriptional LysR family regulator